MRVFAHAKSQPLEGGYFLIYAVCTSRLSMLIIDREGGADLERAERKLVLYSDI